MKRTWALCGLAFVFTCIIDSAAYADSSILGAEDEYVALKKFPTIAKRTKTGLFIYKDGKALKYYKKIDCNNDNVEDDCVAVTFFGGVDIFNTKTSKKETYPVIFKMGYEWYDYEILGLGEVLELDTHPLASPDGKTIATGADIIDGMTGGGALSFYNITNIKDPITFEIPCEPQKWLDNKSVEVKCSLPDDYGEKFFDATAFKDNTKGWKIVPDNVVGKIEKVYYPQNK